ncbi:hypothetical protein JP0492_07130 [Helicobacter pylori]
MLPESDFYKNKQKFLAIFKAEELLLKSQFKQLGKFIAGTLLENSRKKIVESNCNKALKVIEKLQKTIVTTIDRQINPTIKEIKNHQQEVCDNLDRSRDKFVSNLRNSAFKEIERFKSDFRIEMYAHIDDGIEDDECKVMFKHELQKGMEKLGENIKKRFEKDEQQFRKDLQEDIEQFKDRIENFLERLNRINIDHDSNHVDINTDKGINKLGLFSSIVSLVFGIFNSWNPIGWASTGLGLAGIGKSVWSFFSPSYKKSQQKKQWMRF